MYSRVLQRYFDFVKKERQQKHESRKDSYVGEDTEEEEPKKEKMHEAEKEKKSDDNASTAKTLSTVTREEIGSAIKPHDKTPHKIKIEKVLRERPKTYRSKASSLMKYLLRMAILFRLYWNERGVVTINGTIVPNFNIADLINDAIRERKTVRATGRLQFARLRRVDTSAELVGNRSLWNAVSRTRESKNLTVQQRENRMPESTSADNIADSKERIYRFILSTVKKRIPLTRSTRAKSTATPKKKQICDWRNL